MMDDTLFFDDDEDINDCVFDETNIELMSDFSQGRYQVGVYDGMTYSIADSKNDDRYMLYVTPIKNNTFSHQVLIAPTIDSSPCGRFVVFQEEVYSISFYAYNRSTVDGFVYSLLSEMNEYFELSNPVELGSAFGGTVRNKVFELPDIDVTQYH